MLRLAIGSPRKREILSMMLKVNSYQLEPPFVDAWQAKNPINASWVRPWPQTAWYTGVMAAWEATKDRALLKKAIRYGHELHWGLVESHLELTGCFLSRCGRKFISSRKTGR